MTIGERIKQKRLELNMSQDELGKKVGYKSRSSIQKIENARNLPLPKVEKMAIALECSPAYLMGWEDEDHEMDVVTHPNESYLENEEFIELYTKADPEIQNAVLTLLKSAKQ